MRPPDPPELVLRVTIPPPAATVDSAAVTFTYDELVFLATAVNCYTYQPNSTRSRLIRHPVCIKLAKALQTAAAKQHWYWTPGVTVLPAPPPPQKVWGHTKI